MNRTGVVLAASAGARGDGRGRGRRRRLQWGRGKRGVAAEYEEVAKVVREKGGYDLVEVGYEEGGEPTIAAAVEAVIKRGASRVVIVPQTMLNSNPAELIAGVQERHPDVEIVCAKPRVDKSGYAESIICRVREDDPWYIGTAAGLGVVRLAAIKPGERAVIDGFDAGHTLVSRLSALGFTPDAEVTMIQNYGSGPVIVSVRDTRIALGRGEATKIRVRRMDNGE
jgi:ferrous iron transport protein A